MKQFTEYNRATESSATPQGAIMPIRCTLRVVIARENLRRSEAGEPELTQAQIARDTGLEEAQISRLVTGKQRMIGFDTLDKLCRYFKVQPGELLQYYDEPDRSDG